MGTTPRSYPATWSARSGVSDVIGQVELLHGVIEPFLKGEVPGRRYFHEDKQERKQFAGGVQLKPIANRRDEAAALVQ